ncbi:S-adenosyl-L-methionine-dependent methyltransferase [Hysterangium stoloniferum]|nr:S-adenosyl-L-methionine-dependent methyltransferase [Hysterangium stoloniferum]
MSTSLPARLFRSLGSSQMEVKWMRQAARNHQDLQAMLNRRLQGEPLQYILGTQPFGPLNIKTRPPVLIPRPETEQWTSELADQLHHIWLDTGYPHKRPLKVLDLCTGTGCIPLLLYHLLNNHGLRLAALGIDISSNACKLATENIASINPSSVSAVDVQQKDLFDDDFWEFVENSFRQPTLRHIFSDSDGVIPLDVITANPPYIPDSQWQDLSPEVKDWEDPVALLGDLPLHKKGEHPSEGGKGLCFYERICGLLQSSSSGILSPSTILAMEVGENQACDVVRIFDKFGNVKVWKDLWGKERAIFIYGMG